MVFVGFFVLFFLVVWFFFRKLSKILDYVGKFLNLLFLVLLGILIVLVFVKLLGYVVSVVVGENYILSFFFKGFIEGYNMLDVLVLLVFGIVVVLILWNMGVEKLGDIVKGMIKLGVFSVVLMGIIYILFVYMGIMSIGVFLISENGGIVLV